ncbi:MAG: FAD-dependent thymidylate synthase [Candidatus Bathyarchaeia archaeon]
MLNYYLIGNTPYHGQIIVLEGRPYEVAALRIFISTQKPMKKLGIKSKNVLELINEINQNPSLAKQYVKEILSYSHGDIGEMGSIAVYLKDISRLASFLCWLPIGAKRGIQGVGTELSLRYVEPKNFVNLPGLESLNQESLRLYSYLIENGVPREDARYILPLSTKTELIIQIPVGREIAKLANHLERQEFLELKTIANAIDVWNKENGFIFPFKEAPNSNIPIKMNEENIRRIELRKILHDKVAIYNKDFETLIAFRRASIASMHQDVRNRQVYFYWPSWERIITSFDFHIPKSLEKFKEEILTHLKKMHEFSMDKWNLGNYDLAVYSTPLSKTMEVFSLIHGDQSIFYTIRLRTCQRTQEEIRKYYLSLIPILYKEGFQLRLGPMCITDKKCFEFGKEKCSMYKSIIAKKLK